MDALSLLVRQRVEGKLLDEAQAYKSCLIVLTLFVDVSYSYWPRLQFILLVFVVFVQIRVADLVCYPLYISLYILFFNFILIGNMKYLDVPVFVDEKPDFDLVLSGINFLDINFLNRFNARWT